VRQNVHGLCQLEGFIVHETRNDFIACIMNVERLMCDAKETGLEQISMK
jgi:hypothetical protein